MIIDARTLTNGERIQADVCIVGGGVAGISLAKEMMQKSDLNICVLESGAEDPKKEYAALNEGDNVGLDYYPLDSARGRQFGGSAGRWVMEIGDGRLGARLRPFSPIDFEERDWVPHSGWPFGFDHIEPYLKRAHQICKGGDSYDYDINDLSLNKKMQPLPLDPKEVETAIYQFVPRNAYIKDYKEEFGRCDNVNVYLYATTQEIVTSEEGNVATGVRAACLDGKEIHVDAKLVVLALGGIETPRLMLMSNAVNKNGVGNQNDVVGRYWMEHPHLWSGLLVPNDRNHFKSSLLYDKEKMGYREKDLFLGQLAIPDDVLRREKILSYACHIMPAARPKQWVPTEKKYSVKRSLGDGAQTSKLLLNAIRNGDLNEFNRHISAMFPVGNDLTIALYRSAAKNFNKLFRNHRQFEVYKLNHMTEQQPNPDSRITLSDEKDAFGKPKVCLDWRLTELDIWSIRRAQELIHAEAERSGFGVLEMDMTDNTIPSDIHGGYHHMGSTRMHNDPKQGVVDENCKVHDVENLYIAGSSVFTTGGYANPVLTAVALTIRLADHLKAHKV